MEDESKTGLELLRKLFKDEVRKIVLELIRTDEQVNTCIAIKINEESGGGVTRDQVEDIVNDLIAGATIHSEIEI
jgi:hypothetical protein